MSLLHFRIFGYEIDDSLTIKLIAGFACIIILLLLIGLTPLSDWVTKSLVIWIGVTLLVVPVVYFFIEETLEMKQLVMIILGVAILVAYTLLSSLSIMFLITSVLEAIVSMTVLSIILDEVKNRIK